LTPQEIFEHRLAALLGCSIGDLLELPARELDRWRLYWAEEPWGPYRDNMHAAMIVTELLKPHLKRGSPSPSIRDYLFEHPDDATNRRRAAAYRQFMNNRGKK
jgi:hypothetical protein